jgi:hypothetical protein
VPGLAGHDQIVVIPGQTLHTTEAAAEAESYATLGWGAIPFSELVMLYQVTLRHNASNPQAYSNTPRAAIVRASRIVGSRASITQAAQTDHGALAGLDDDDHPHYLTEERAGALYAAAGAWTPTLTPGSGAITSATASGRYTVTGDRLTLQVQIDISDAGTASGALTVSLPATTDAAAGEQVVIGVDATDGVALYGLAAQNTAALVVRETGGSSPIASGAALRLAGTIET